MKYLRVDYLDGQIALIGKVSRSSLGALEALLQILQERWIAAEQQTSKMVADQGTWSVFQAIANLMTRYEIPGQKGFDLEPIRSDIEQLERLFLFQIEGEQYKCCQLVELLQFEPLPVPNWQQTDDSLDRMVPSCGNPEMDVLASLSVAFTVTEAFKILDTLDAESLDRFQAHVNELRRDPEERQTENLAGDFAAWKEENSDAYQEALGIKFKRPADAKDP